MAGLHAAIDALLDITTTHGIRAHDVQRIDVDLSEPVYHHGWWLPERPLTPTGAQMNIAYALAVALLDGEALAQQFSPSRIDADDVWQIIPRITAHHRAQFDELGSLGAGQTELRLTLNDGTGFSSTQFAARSILEPLSNAAVVEKFRHLTSGVVTTTRRERLIEIVTNLDHQTDLTELDRLLRPIVTSPFDDAVPR
jgi:2-methylcitrate dehydratase PrpD